MVQVYKNLYNVPVPSNRNLGPDSKNPGEENDEFFKIKRNCCKKFFFFLDLD
jgi:hypothetical protein